MKPSLVDIPVLLIFFNRPEPLKKVFNSIRQARPSKLFLIQDGARKNRPDDEENINKCRKVVSEIDWECEIYTNYSESNLSCDPRVFSGISWAFQYVDRLIILEDDCVPSGSFFQFCAEILEKYKNDERIQMISGMNHIGEDTTNSDSYFFSQSGAGWGWATWKRAWEKVELQKDFDYLVDPHANKLMSNLFRTVAPKGYKNFTLLAQKKRLINIQTGKVSTWENAVGVSTFLQSQLVILPTKNLISNIGLTEDSTHAVNNMKKLSKGIQRVFNMETYELEFPLKHPKFIIRDVEYEEKVRKIMNPNIIIKFYRRIETFLRKIIFTKKSERKSLLTYYIKKFTAKN
ncbi:hypothetical protein BKC07_04455 [Peribacillus simplex]|nr:hypothetical protein BKC07_04455 [Peribacillus simplex]